MHSKGPYILRRIVSIERAFIELRKNVLADALRNEEETDDGVKNGNSGHNQYEARDHRGGI